MVPWPWPSPSLLRAVLYYSGLVLVVCQCVRWLVLDSRKRRAAIREVVASSDAAASARPRSRSFELTLAL